MVIVCFILPGIPTSAQTTGNEDIRLRLNEEFDRKAAAAEAKLLKDAQESDKISSSLVIDGQTYSVSNNVNEMGQALYISVMRKRWIDVRRFLKIYLSLQGHDPMLVLYARGALARSAGDLSAAEGFYQELIALQTDFLPGRLEHARVLFENHKNGQALHMFHKARNLLHTGNEKVAGVRRTIDSFIAALHRRKAWQGSFAIGPAYSSNLNQSSASHTCLLPGEDGSCLFDRKVPDPIQAGGLGFEGTLSRIFPLDGHNGIHLRAQLYGDAYYSQAKYNQATVITQLGYNYRTARNNLSFSFSHDFGTFGTDILYNAFGVRAEWMHTISRAATLKLELNHKILKYHQDTYRSQNGSLGKVYLTGWYSLPDEWVLFGGGDFSDKTADDPVNAYRQAGLRFGFNKSFNSEYNLLMFASFQRQDYRAYSELFEAQRRDDVQNYTVILKLPIRQFSGLTPSIMLQHYRVKSNIDWLYSHHKNVVSLKLEGRF